MPAEAVVATDPASANADCDNGGALHGTPRCGRREVAASGWVATTYSKAAGCFYCPHVGPRKPGQRPA